MKFQRKRREKVDITLISMIDVLFVLLLFFMVSTTFNRHTVMKIQLPEANSAAAETIPKNITVSIDEKGDYGLAAVDQETRKLPDHSRETLLRELSKLASQDKDIPFIISADAKAPYQSVMRVLDIAGQLGFNHISFPTEEPEQEPESEE